MSTINTYSDIDRRDSLQKKFAEVDNTIYVAEVSLTAANIIAMNATPVEVVAAQGAGKVIEFVGATIIFDNGDTAFTGGGAVEFQNSTVGDTLSTTVPATIFTSDADKIYQAYGASASAGWTANDNIVITNATAAFATGDGVARIKVAYRVHESGL